MREPRWLSRLVVDTIHSELLQDHGGAPGIREGRDAPIESAIARPRNRFVHEKGCDLPALAASYLFGLVRNHAYLAGNNRVGLAMAATFLLVNGWRLTADEADAYEKVMATARGDLDEEALATWLRANVTTVALG
jgi:death-on-curing protein